MRAVKAFLSMTILAMSLWQIDAGEKLNPADYKEADYKLLKANPEDYKNKKISVTVEFRGLDLDFPPFVERLGFKEDKFFLIKTQYKMLGGAGIPIFLKKTPETKETVPVIEQKSQVMIYGKVRKFIAQPIAREGAFPDYYLEADGLDIVAEAQPKKKDEADEGQDKEVAQNKRKHPRSTPEDPNLVLDNPLPKPPPAKTK